MLPKEYDHLLALRLDCDAVHKGNVGLIHSNPHERNRDDDRLCGLRLGLLHWHQIQSTGLDAGVCRPIVKAPLRGLYLR